MQNYAHKLKSERERRAWSQEQVAAMIETTAPNISRWERGVTIPSLHFRQKLCKLYDKSLEELGFSLALDEPTFAREGADVSAYALPGTIDTAPALSLQEKPELWRLPHHRNPLFMGRERELHRLHDEFQIQKTSFVALQGIAGIGKTQLAIEYAYRYASEYRAIFWIGAESTETVLSSFLTIAELLGLPEKQETDQKRIIAAVWRWLSLHRPWLLTWDNLEDLEILQRYLHTAQPGACLITTRRQALGSLAKTLELPVFQQEEGALFLLRHAKAPGSEAPGANVEEFAAKLPTEYWAAHDLTKTLGGLPLALDQARAYIEETGCSIADYRERYVQQRGRLLSRRGTPAGDHPQSVANTFRLSCRQLERDHREAADMLKLSTFLYAEAIPEEIFMAEVPEAHDKSVHIVADAYHFDQACAALRTLSLVERHLETRTLTLHRLIQTVLRESMSGQEQRRWQKLAIQALNALFPDVTHDTWGTCERFLPHVLACAASMPIQAEEQDLAEVLYKAANYLRERARYEQAEPLYQRVLHIREQALGPEHPLVAIVLNGLARLFYEQGKYQQAEVLNQRALHIREQALGPEHPLVATSLNNLAIVVEIQGKYEEAEALYQRALRILEEMLGPEHPLAASSLNNLAILYKTQGKCEQAEALFRRTLHVLEEVLGPEHPQIAHPLNGLADLSTECAQYEEAEALYQRALSISEQALGPEHPQVASLLNGLTDLYTRQGKYDQAEPACQRALFISEQAFGSQHPQVAYPLKRLADLFTGQGKYEQAEALYQRALHIREQALGPEHPEVAMVLSGLAYLSRQQARYEQAEVFYQRALHIREQCLGLHHPVTTRTLADLALLSQAQRKYEQ